MPFVVDRHLPIKHVDVISVRLLRPLPTTMGSSEYASPFSRLVAGLHQREAQLDVAGQSGEGLALAGGHA